ncbi:MAG: hypothetical protein EBR82_51685 [Caulobacteraceae bacterium]|nr:hypothetical protein [Caulobacteraceae bacterium]
MTYITDAYATCRDALRATSTSLTDTTLARYLAMSEAALVKQYPCIGSGVTNSLSGTDLTFFSYALGYQMAYNIARDPLAQDLISSTIELKVGPVTKKYGRRDALDYVKGLTAKARENMLLVSCVRSRASGYNNQDMFNLAGHRRDIGDALTVQRQAAGEGQRIVVDIATDNIDMVNTSDI